MLLLSFSAVCISSTDRFDELSVYQYANDFSFPKRKIHPELANEGVRFAYGPTLVGEFVPPSLPRAQLQERDCAGADRSAAESCLLDQTPRGPIGPGFSHASKDTARNSSSFLYSQTW